MPPPNKKRKVKTSAVEEVNFDYAARADYLTGFHKRKVERTKIRQDLAKKREREERIEERKRIREERKADLERHVKEVNALLPKMNGVESNQDDRSEGDAEEVWNGMEDPAPPIDHEDEYVDEDRYTSVTVEEVDVSRDGLSKVKRPAEPTQETEQPKPDNSKSVGRSNSRLNKKKVAPDKDKSRKLKKKRNFRYESKVDRKHNYLKVKAKNSKQAKARKGD